MTMPTRTMPTRTMPTRTAQRRTVHRRTVPSTTAVPSTATAVPSTAAARLRRSADQCSADYARHREQAQFPLRHGVLLKLSGHIAPE
jgi:hypothetical protein